MIYLVTGGAGSLGRRLTEHLLYQTEDARIRVLDNHENSFAQMRTRLVDPAKRVRFLFGDIRDKDRMQRAMENVDVCIHCAALKHVDIAEQNPFESLQTNVIGTQNCIDVALQADIDKFLYLSSDKAVLAISTYGRCKAVSESLTLDANNYKGDRRTKFSVARPPNYIDSDGSVFELWRYQKKHGLPITVTDVRMERFFMPFPDIVNFTLKCVEIMGGREVFVPLGAKREKIIDLARQVSSNIDIIGMRPGERLVEHLYTEEEIVNAEQKEGMWIIH